MVALALVFALVASACGGGKKDLDEVGNPPATNEDGTPATGLPLAGNGGNGPTGGGGSKGSTSSSTPAPTNPGTVRGQGSTTTTTAGGGSVDAYKGARSGPGAFARTLLRPQPATRVVVELLVQQGADPTQGSIDHLLQVLADETRKQVTLADRVALPAGDGTTTADDIRKWSDTYGRTAQGGNQAVVRVLFLRGRYHEPTEPTDDDDGASVLGVAVRGDTLAVFKDTVRSTEYPLVSAAVIEDAVLTHEMGHLLGLVDLVLDTGREDPTHRGHSANENSVMYWKIEQGLSLRTLGKAPPRNFDSDDKADLATMRNGG